MSDETEIEVDTEHRNLMLKYRPKKFEQVVGAENVVPQLQEMVKQKKPPTALLFTGPSGVGKTSLARLLGRYLNCDTKDACGVCASCVLMDLDEHPDVREVNAASDRGIDATKELIRNLFYMPQHNVRVVILDEAHMLTPQAVQVLLKPIEEPPAHTMFCICTTDPEKLPGAIIGRCLRMSLHFIEAKAIMNHLHRISKLEGVNLLKPVGKETEEQAKDRGRGLLRVIADLSNGQMRDALSILESFLKTVKNNPKADIRVLVDNYKRRFDLGADRVAVKSLFNIYRGSLKAAISAMFDHDQPRGVLRKMVWTNEKVLRHALDAAVPFQDLAYRDISVLLKEKKMQIPLQTLLHVQSCLTQAEITMNSTSIPELQVMTDAVYRAALPQFKSRERK